MKIRMVRADPVRDAVELSKLDQQIDPVDAWEVEDWEPYYIVFWITLAGEKIGSIAFAPNMRFSRSEDEKRWVRHGSLYLATTGILPQYRTHHISGEVRRWQINWAADHGWEVLSTNCRRSNMWYLSLCKRFGFRQIADIPYFVEPTENTIVLELNVRA